MKESPNIWWGATGLLFTYCKNSLEYMAGQKKITKFVSVLTEGSRISLQFNITMIKGGNRYRTVL
jgi:hypothetical protein